MGRPKSEKKSVISDEWIKSVQRMDYAQLQDAIAKVAKAEDENQKMKADDPDLNALKEQVKEASAQYREATKVNKAKLAYAIEQQETRGRPAANPDGVVVKKS
jgi:DNA repair ATPase RecN